MPFKRLLFTVLRRVWQPGPHIYKHLHFEGAFTVPLGRERQFQMYSYGYLIENSVFWTGLTGNFEGRSVELWLQVAERSTNVIDIGSNTGLYALSAKAVNPASNVYAFEPIRRVYEKLVHNTRINNYDIHCIDSAVSSIDGTGTIFDPGGGTGHVYAASIGKHPNSQRPGDDSTARAVTDQGVNVELVRLDSFVEERNLTKIDLLKIDVEGHEADVLRGFKKHLGLYKPTILVEILSEEVARQVQQIVEEHHYLYFDIDEDGKVEQKDQICSLYAPGENNSHFNYLLCQPVIAQHLNLVP